MYFKIPSLFKHASRPVQAKFLKNEQHVNYMKRVRTILMSKE
jgi:hypothetical protein